MKKRVFAAIAALGLAGIFVLVLALVLGAIAAKVRTLFKRD